MNRTRAVIIFLVLVAFLAVSGHSLRGDEEKTGYKEFKRGEFLEDPFSNEDLRIDDLKVEADHNNAKVNIKNLRKDKRLQVSIYMAIYDANKALVATGNYTSVTGFAPREASEERIELGWASLGKAKYYQILVAYWMKDEK